MFRAAKNDRMKSWVPSVEPVSPITQQAICGATARRQRSRFAISFLTIMLRQSVLPSIIGWRATAGATGPRCLAPPLRRLARRLAGRLGLRRLRLPLVAGLQILLGNPRILPQPIMGALRNLAFREKPFDGLQACLVVTRPEGMHRIFLEQAIIVDPGGDEERPDRLGQRDRVLADQIALVMLAGPPAILHGSVQRFGTFRIGLVGFQICADDVGIFAPERFLELGGVIKADADLLAPSAEFRAPEVSLQRLFL